MVSYCSAIKLKILITTASFLCGTEERPALPPCCIPAEGVLAKFTMREEWLDARLYCYGTSQHGDPVNTKRLFFLDVGRMPVAPQHSIQFHMVSLQHI